MQSTNTSVNDEKQPTTQTKMPYTTPELTIHGKVEDLTQQVPQPSGSGGPVPSDRNIKEAFAKIDPQIILARVAALPITSWNYKSQDAAIRHIGPMAQDFAAAFAVGEDDRHINMVDASGVALAAIQALNTLVREQAQQIATLRQQVNALLTEPALA